jgi:arginyl-tRNA synthetase
MSKEIWLEKEKSIENSENDIKKKYLESRDVNGYIDMAINSVKYYDLSHRYQSDYNFNKHEMVKFDGNTATYVMYIYARLNNILKKKDLELDAQFNPILDIEKKMGLKILEFNEFIEYVCNTHQLHSLVEYVYDLANNFSSLWNHKDGQIIDSPYEQSRLLLCSKLKKVFEIIFGIFGMKLLDSV